MERLNLSYNELSILPNALNKLKVLTHLSLAHNKIAAAEAGWSFGLSPMIELDISHNQLTDDAFKGTAMAAALQLQKLDIRNNQLTAMPVTVCRNCHELRAFHLDHNQISQAPDELAELKKLRYLTMSHNLLTTMPRPISYLNNLLGLSLAYNLLTAPPPLRATLRGVHMEGNPYYDRRDFM